MRKVTLFIVISLITLLSNATVLIDETFNYTVSKLAEEATWTTAGTLTTGTGRSIVTSALTYSDAGKTYILSGVGNTLNSDISSASDYKSYKPFSPSPINSGAVYLSFLYKADVAQGQTNSEVMGLADGISQGPRLWAGKGSVNAANYRFGLTRGSTTSATIIWGTEEFADVSETMLVIIKYDFATTTASVFINPTLGSVEEPVADIIDNTTTTIRTKLDNLWFRSQGTSAVKFNVGGIRVATTWAEVVADRNTPKLAAPTVNSATEITGEGFTANWSIVENATGYAVNVYEGTTLAKTSQISGGTTTNAEITGLLPNTRYTYKVIAKGNGADYSDSEESAASDVFQTLNTGIDTILTNFGDASWGTPVSSAPLSGSYPTTTVNGFTLVKSVLLTGSVTCETGESHVNRILLDKNSQGAAIEFPALKTVGEVEIHAATGTEAMSFRLEEWVSSQWQVIDTYITRKSPDSIYTIPLPRNNNTKLRIANNTGSGLYIYKIVTRTYQETIDLSLRSSSPAEGEVCYYNLKKAITLNFNKDVALGSGSLLLNGVSIPLNTSIITGNVVTIPVQLEGTPSVNKSYTFTASAGCFVEKDSLTNESKAIVVNFQTFRMVAYPANYAAQLDVVYKNVNSPNTRMDIYYPTNPEKPVPVVINMHGGGWVSGEKEQQGGFNMYFNQGYAVANVEYRMRYEALAPAAVEDVRGAMIYLLHHAEALNIDKSKIIFQGGSAGGHLALTAGYLQNNRIYDNDTEPYADEIKVMAVIDKYGPSKLSDFLFYSSLASWLGDNATNQAFVQSISPVDMIDANTPPTYIIHGDADPTVPYSQSVILQAALEQAGVKNKFTTVPGGGHGGFLSAYNTQYEIEVIQFLSEVIAIQEANSDVKSFQERGIKYGVSDRKITILSEEEISVTVLNALGKEMLITKDKTFSVPQNGFYILKIQIDKTDFVQKILIN
ncbi:MAG: alpha/beta hydrolase fold domain-containing protein [Paludibacter sp.]|nr:alpha/beta hydrolase fold domain-containing protein [Paludibacter sp.]